MKLYGIILAAGYGNRLRPLTTRIPKPLLPLCGKTILDLALENLFAVGVEKIAVNAHHLSSQIIDAVNQSPFSKKVVLYPEDPILGTGGPLVNAKSFLSESDAFILHNGDVACNFDIRAMLEKHRTEKNIATMALIPGPENRVLCSRGKVCDILGRLGANPDASSELRTYACVTIFSPEIFRYLPEEPCFTSLIDGILKALAERSDSIGAYFPEPDCFWSDIGSFEQYFETNSMLLNASEPILPGIGASVASRPVFIGKNSIVDPSAKLSGYLSVGKNCRIGADASLTNCILLDGTEIENGDFRANEIVGPDGFSCHRDIRTLETLKLLSENYDSAELRISSLAEQGSSRKFYRVGNHAESRILMISSADDADYGRFLEIGVFCNRNSLRTPNLYGHEDDRFAVLMEDLGNDTIYELAIKRRDDEVALENLYRNVVDAAADFQVRGTHAVEREHFSIRPFDHEYLRWETDYFKRQFLKNVCGIQLKENEEKELDREFELLAEQAGCMAQTLMHRDFQSQNILLHQGKIRFVDYQGARIGPYTYDIMALLKDPYFSLDTKMRQRLVKYHHCTLNVLGMSVSEERHAQDCIVASLQRNMQCLGAYGFLSVVKRKLKYLQFAEPCLGYLEDGLAQSRNFPELETSLIEDLCNRAKANLQQGIEQVVNAEC